MGILLVAAFLRVANLNYGDTLTDEVLYAFRAVGMLDFDEAAEQTTPLEWFDPAHPWWTRLSFHDHPPFVFFTQYIFMSVFGEKSWAFRLPSALLGVLSVLLLYLIVRKLYSQKVALTAAALLAVTTNHVYISRLGIQESYVIFFILLTVYFFVRSLEKDSYLVWGWMAVGFGILTKYTTAVALPIALVFLFIRNRKHFRNKKFWLGVLLAILITSPVIIYNFYLWRAVGHLDFQLSYVFGQDYPEWQVQPGKEIGSLRDRARNFFPNILAVHSWAFLALASAGLLFATSRAREHTALWLVLFFHLLLFAAVGTAYRFVSMLTPWLALVAALVIDRISPKKVFFAVVAGVLLFEAAYAANSVVTFYPMGPKVWAFAKGARLESFNYGFYELDRFMQEEFRGKHPTAAFYQQYKFLERLHENALKTAVRTGLVGRSAVFVYDGNIDTAAQLWVLDRWQIYHAWPVVRTEAFNAHLQENRIQGIKSPDFEEHYFIALTDKTPKKQPSKRTEAGALFESELVRRGITPHITLANKLGEEMFRIYRF